MPYVMLDENDNIFLDYQMMSSCCSSIIPESANQIFVSTPVRYDCPGCGAPLEGGECEYCGRVF